MPRYFFHLHNHGRICLDEEGRDLPDHAAMIAATLHEARSMIGHDAMGGTIRLDHRIDVADEDAASVHSLAFADAVDIIR